MALLQSMGGGAALGAPAAPAPAPVQATDPGGSLEDLLGGLGLVQLSDKNTDKIGFDSDS